MESLLTVNHIVIFSFNLIYIYWLREIFIFFLYTFNFIEIAPLNVLKYVNNVFQIPYCCSDDKA